MLNWVHFIALMVKPAPMMRSMIFPVLPAPVASGLIMVNVRLVAMGKRLVVLGFGVQKYIESHGSRRKEAKSRPIFGA